MSSNTSGEGDIRKNIIEADLVDCMIALPGQLFYNTGIQPASGSWLATRKQRGFRDRRGEVLFIDARNMGVFRKGGQGELTDKRDPENCRTLTMPGAGKRAECGKYEDVPGFCKVFKP